MNKQINEDYKTYIGFLFFIFIPISMFGFPVIMIYAIEKFFGYNNIWLVSFYFVVGAFLSAFCIMIMDKMWSPNTPKKIMGLLP